jgi:hypothetical protein
MNAEMLRADEEHQFLKPAAERKPERKILAGKRFSHAPPPHHTLDRHTALQIFKTAPPQNLAIKNNILYI